MLPPRDPGGSRMVATARFSTLQDWLDWQETLHPAAIDLGLERVARVAERLDCRTPAPLVISVAGTNGKGSCVAMLEAILLRAGYRVAAYTSPHLHRYNERLRLNGECVDDATLCAAFARVDVAREDDTLTYFEFGTLAALEIMSRQALDVALLEVGLGGRLDAVNIVDADAALISSIGVDHTDWLGPDRDAIATEKAGIMRAGRPAICGDSEPPQTLMKAAGCLGADLAVLGRQFCLHQAGRRWHWQGRRHQWRDLPHPALPGSHQLANAASVLAVLEALEPRLRVSREALEGGLKWVRLPARVQRIAGPVEQVLDVSHNVQAAQALADALHQLPLAGRCYAVLGMMRDKDVAAFVQPLLARVDAWYVTGLQVDRAGSAVELAARIERAAPEASVVICPNVADAVAKLKHALQAGDRVLVCGSFYTVAQWSALKPEFTAHML